MAVPISNVVRRVVFAPSGVGPYAFTFEILANTDIEVYKGDTLLTLTTDYTVTINANGTGSVTLVATAGTDNITIVGARTIERTTDFVTGGDLFANSLNEELDSLTIFVQQNSESGDRAIKAPVTDPTTIDMTLPVKTSRAGKYLSFNTSTGNPEVVNNVVDVTAVAGIAADITTVAGISGNVTTVAGVAANVTTVAGVAANVTTVAGVAANVTTVAGISADVTTVAADGTDIGAVAAVSSDVAALSPIAADITAVAGVDSDVTAVAGIAANVTTVAGVAANVTTVAGVAANVTTVAGISAAVTTVAGDSADIQLLADNIASIASKASAGANSDITSLSGLTTPLSVVQGGTGITSFGTGVATFLGTPSSANLAAAVTDETGSGSLVFATSPTFVTPVLGTPTSGTLSTCTVDGTDAVGFRNTPVNSQSADYTLVLADSGKTIFHPAADNNARTFTIPANSSVAYPVGTVLTFVNLAAADVTIAITTDTMYLAGPGTTGSRTLAEYGIASAVKLASTDWLISGNGLT